MKKNLVVIEELKKQGKALLDARRDNFVRQSLLSDEFLNFMQQNKKPFDLLMSYYECAIMEVETKFRVLNHELSLEYDNNPIESIKTRVKSYDSILKKIRRKNIPLNLRAIEDNLKDIAGVRVICSFPDDIYKLAESFLKQDDITLIERKDYIKNPKPSGYRCRRSQGGIASQRRDRSRQPGESQPTTRPEARMTRTAMPATSRVVHCSVMR